jgi:hypothetical protein
VYDIEQNIQIIDKLVIKLVENIKKINKNRREFIMSKIVENPSIEITTNFKFDQKDKCYECYNKISSLILDFFSDKPECYNYYDIDTVDHYSDGYYFNVYISLKYPGLIKDIMYIIFEYS